MIKDFDIILNKGEGYTVEFKEAVDKSIDFLQTEGKIIYDYIVDVFR